MLEDSMKEWSKSNETPINNDEFFSLDSKEKE